MKFIQTGFRLVRGIKTKIKGDTARYAVSQDVVVEVAIENLFSKFTPEERANFYVAQQRARIK